ncbi:hypothetical protein [Streptomyces sp. MJP52]|uniref:hypothetical protein n=1 Tax=Streptomyces sp. MJP52 TaxID=2940555 RepID=UPI0024755850|nr:hypothetical protein [Streptomyces sp. MJP52]MDH6224433.1 hypothetical protein [Streptomyces sp. MJP52]
MSGPAPARSRERSRGRAAGSVGDRTADVRAWLGARRGAERRRRFASRLYTAVVLLGGWYGLFLAGLLAQVRSRPFAAHAAVTEAVLPAGLAAAAAAALWAAVRDALWRGPVTPPAPDVDWLLALPVRRRTVLLPWFALSAGIWAAAALLLGTAGAALLAAAGLGALGPLTAACAGGALCTALLAVASAALVQGSRRAAGAVHRAAPWAVTALALAGAQAVAAARGSRARWLETAEMWSGPWGWAAQPVLAAAGGHAPLWPVAALLTASVTAVTLGLAVRRLDGIPAGTLRARARAADGVLAGVLASDPRVVRLATARAREPRGRGRTARWAGGLTAPRSPRPLMVWRDAVALLAAPRRTASAVALLLLAAAAAATAGGGPLATAAAALAAHGAAARLLETARLDGDDPRRAAWSPRPFEWTVTAHAVVPTAVLTAAGAGAALLTGGRPVLFFLLGAVPVTVAAALVSAYRPPTRTALLYGSPALAGAGPALALLWHAAGPLAGVTAVTVLLGGTGGPPGVRTAACWAVSAVLLLWARRRARALVRP